MSSLTWTPDELASNSASFRGRVWRLVEAQHQVSTLKLVDTLKEQEVLEDLIHETKPPVRSDCPDGMSYLLSTPFRYRAVYPTGSRFRRAGLTPGVFYGSDQVETAVAEMAFYRLLFFADSPGTPWPADAKEFTAFCAEVSTSAIELTVPPFAAAHTMWTDLTDYHHCQDFADLARSAGVGTIRYLSVRDPKYGLNSAVLACSAFTSKEPVQRESWRLRLSSAGVQAIREFPSLRLEFDRLAFNCDPRLAGFRWDR